MPFEIKNLQYHTIKSANFSFNQSDCIGISGPSGSGKSLLLRALADLDPHQGEILLDKKLQQAFKPNEWRQKVGLLPAESQWWFDTVGEHFKEYNKDILIKIGFDATVMEWDVSRLSSGEKQRLALLRLLMNQPIVLLLDEPTANLDPQFVEHVESILSTYKWDMKAILIWVSHDQNQLRRVADRRFEIRDQQIVEVTHE